MLHMASHHIDQDITLGCYFVPLFFLGSKGRYYSDSNVHELLVSIIEFYEVT